MRTWQQLTAEAEATGTWTNYQGDGATVPWECAGAVSAPLGLSMWAYKAYLDLNYPAAFKLHDWLYTQYGSLIAATRAEADAALRQQILDIGGITSTVDAAVVFAAVDQFGGPYFGISPTGFDPGLYLWAYRELHPDQVGGNIGIAPLRVSSPSEVSMSIKCVVVFQQVTEKGGSQPFFGLAGRQHIGGWTESYWFPSDNLTDLLAQLKGNNTPTSGLLPARAGLLASGATIIGVRLYQGGAGKGQFRALAYPGSLPNLEIPQMAILCYASLAGTTAIKRLTLRGIPDSQVSGGEFTPTPTFVGRLVDFGAVLQNFGTIANDVVTSYPVYSVSNAGLVTLNAVANPFAVGATVTFRNVLNAVGNRVGGSFVVATIGPMGNQFSVTPWPHGDCTGGDVRIPTKSIYTITPGSFTISRVVTRKVGRPFEMYRGRNSRRAPAA